MEQHRNPNGTYNGLAVMAELTGLSKADMHTIWGDVKANQARLNGCARHAFEPAPAGRMFAERRTCRVCGGWADARAVEWYERGLAHGVTG